MSTGIRMIVPDAFDFTSTTLTGSTVPFACTVRTMLRRSTGAVSITSAVLAFFEQAAPATSVIPMRIFPSEPHHDAYDFIGLSFDCGKTSRPSITADLFQRVPRAAPARCGNHTAPESEPAAPLRAPPGML